MARISKRPSVSCFFLVLLIAFCLGSLPCQAEAPKATTSSGTSGEGKVVEITDRNYDALVHDGPWMIVVSASWCPHCKQLQPTWEKLAEKLEGKTKVGKIDGPEQKIVTKRLHIKGFPTIFHIDKKGKIRDYGEKSRDLEKVKQQKKKAPTPTPNLLTFLRFLHFCVEGRRLNPKLSRFVLSSSSSFTKKKSCTCLQCQDIFRPNPFLGILPRTRSSDSLSKPYLSKSKLGIIICSPPSHLSLLSSQIY